MQCHGPINNNKSYYIELHCLIDILLFHLHVLLSAHQHTLQHTMIHRKDIPNTKSRVPLYSTYVKCCSLLFIQIEWEPGYKFDRWYQWLPQSLSDNHRQIIIITDAKLTVILSTHFVFSSNLTLTTDLRSLERTLWNMECNLI